MVKKRTRLWLLPVMLAAAGFCYLDNCTVQTTFHTLCCANLPEAFSGPVSYTHLQGDAPDDLWS